MPSMDSDWWHKPWPTGLLLFGILMLVLAMIGTFTGKTYGKGGSAERAKNSVDYWLTLAVQYLGGIFLILLWACEMRR
jgi:hypothetical protein